MSSSLKKVREERGLGVISQPVTPGMKDTSALDQNTLGKYNRVFWSKQYIEDTIAGMYVTVKIRHQNSQKKL